jgi:hypothetical protein
MKKAPAVILFAVAFAFVESAVVEYLRALYYPIDHGGFRFPLLTVTQLESMGAEHLRRLTIELGRELSTLVMLAATAAAAGSNRREAWAHFIIAFGIWDFFYYLWLKIFIGWPQGIMTWDLLFLLPVPWVSPVLAPVLVSVTMICCGFVVLALEDRGTPVKPHLIDWVLLTLGGLVVILSFCWDYRSIMQGGLPSSFPWLVFFSGLGIGIGTFVVRAFKSRKPPLRHLKV